MLKHTVERGPQKAGDRRVSIEGAAKAPVTLRSGQVRVVVEPCPIRS